MRTKICGIIILTLLAFQTSFAQSDKLRITPLTGDFYIFTTWNTYKEQKTPANGMYLVTTAGVILFDTPWDSTQFQPLLDSIHHRHQQKVIFCIATHSHEDRTAGLAFYTAKGIKTYTSYKTDSLSKLTHHKRAAFHFQNDTTFRMGQYSFQTFYPGPGHTADNIVIWFPKEKILYGGCFIKSTEAQDLGFTGEANLRLWPLSIRRLMNKCGQPAFVIPGHQGWDSKSALDHTLTLLKKAH